MSPKRSGARSSHGSRHPASDIPDPTVPLIEGTIRLAKALAAHVTGGCTTREEFYSIMGPAQGLVHLVPRDWTTCSAAMHQYLFTAHFRAIALLLAALAWSAPAVVPGHTPFGMEPFEGGRVWEEVAAHCAKMIGTALPSLPEGPVLLQQLLKGAQLAGPGLPAPQEWMATLAAALVATPDPCPDLHRLAAHLVHLWGACCLAGAVAGADLLGSSWALYAARHMQRLLQLLCSRQDTSLDGEHHDMDAAMVAVVLVWCAHRRSALDPSTQATAALYLAGMDARHAAGIRTPLQIQLHPPPQRKRQEQQQQCSSGPSAPPCAAAAAAAAPEDLPAGAVQALQPGAGAAAPSGEEVDSETEETEGEWADVDELAAGLALLQPQAFWWLLLATLCALHHAWTPLRPGAAPVPRYNSLLAYPIYMAALEAGQVQKADCMLHRQQLLMGMCVSALLQSWMWFARPAQAMHLHSLKRWSPHRMLPAFQDAAAAAGASGAREQQATGRTVLQTAAAAAAGQPCAGHKACDDSSSSRCGDDGGDLTPARDQGRESSSSSSSSSKGGACQHVADSIDVSRGDVAGNAPEPVQRILWPLLPGLWSGLQVENHGNQSSAVEDTAPPVPSNSNSSSNSSNSNRSSSTSPSPNTNPYPKGHGLQPVVFPLKPTQHQLRVVLEACLWEHQGQRTGGMWSGLLLLSVMLSMADPTVRMTFLAGIPGEVLLRLLGEVAAGEEGAAPAQADIAGPGASRPAAKAGFMQWPSGCGALGLTAVLDQLGVAGVAIPTRQSVLQVLLWCFFEVASPQQQKQQDDSTTTTSSSSSSPPELSPEHTQELQVAAQQGALWSSSQDPGLIMPLLAMPADWVRLVPGYTPSPLLLLLLNQLGGGLGQEEEEGQQEGNGQQQQQTGATTSSSGTFAATWWEMTLQVLAAAVGAGLEAAEGMAPAAAAAAPAAAAAAAGPAAAAEPHPSGASPESAPSPAGLDTTLHPLVPSPAALPFWAPLAALAGRFVECSRQQQQQVAVQRVAHLGAQLAQAAVLARCHPTGITTYAVPSHCVADCPCALRAWVDDLALRHTQLQQEVGVYADLCRRLAPLLPVLDPDVCERVGLQRIMERGLELEEDLQEVGENLTILLCSWQHEQKVATALMHTVVQVTKDMADDPPSDAQQYGCMLASEVRTILTDYYEQQQPQQQPQQQQQQGSGGASGEHTDLSQQQQPQQQQQQSAVMPVGAADEEAISWVAPAQVDVFPSGPTGQDPLPFMPPGGRVFMPLLLPSDLPPAASDAFRELVLSRGVWATTHQQWLACRLALRLLAGAAWYSRWCGASASLGRQVFRACVHRLGQLEGWDTTHMREEVEEEGDGEQACDAAGPAPMEPQPSGSSRRGQEPPLDPAQVLAAARACFGGLYQAAQQLQALGVGREEQQLLPGVGSRSSS